MSARLLRRLGLGLFCVSFLVSCGGNSPETKNATAENMASTASDSQKQSAESVSASSMIEYKGMKTVFGYTGHVIAVIMDEKINACLEAIEDEDKYDEAADYFEKVVDRIHDNYIAKHEHANDSWVAYVYFDDAQEGVIRYEFGIAEDQKSANMMAMDTVTGKFESILTAKLSQDGELTITDKGEYKDSPFASFGPRPI